MAPHVQAAPAGARPVWRGEGQCDALRAYADLGQMRRAFAFRYCPLGATAKGKARSAMRGFKGAAAEVAGPGEADANGAWPRFIRGVRGNVSHHRYDHPNEVAHPPE